MDISDVAAKVSFVIPTFNCAEDLELCLESIMNQDYPSIEVLVVDEGSADQTLEVAKKYDAKVLFCKGTLGKRRQIGVDKSSGEIIALFDSDVVIPHEQWLRRAVERFSENELISTVWPINRPVHTNSMFTKLYFDFAWFVMEDRYLKGRGVYGGSNSLFRRKYLQDVGGFDPNVHWASDFEIAKKLADKGYRVILHKDVLVHNARRNYAEFVRKEIIGGYSFSKSGFSLTNMSVKELLLEHIFGGVKFMFQQIFEKKNLLVLMYPLLLVTRLLIYGIIFVIARL